MLSIGTKPLLFKFSSVYGLWPLLAVIALVVVFQVADAEPSKAQPIATATSKWSDGKKDCASRIAITDAKKQLVEAVCGIGLFQFVRSRNPEIKRLNNGDVGRNSFSVEVNGVAASFNTVEPLVRNRLPLQSSPSVVWVERVSNYTPLQCLWTMSLSDAARALSLKPSTESAITLPPKHPLQSSRLAAWDASYDGVVVTLYSSDDLDGVAAVYVSCSQ
jgi:hypothetical protein